VSKSKLFEDWQNGIDRRRERAMTEPDRLWNAKNVYIDDGGRLRGRPGLYKLATFTNCEGLLLYNGVLYTFTTTGAAGTTSGFASVLTVANGPAGQTVIKRVWFAQPFAASYYAVVEFSDGTISHYYAGARVTDANCPNTNRVTIAGNRVWCANNAGQVYFSKLDDATNWTPAAGASDPGFLAASSQAPGMGAIVQGLGTYQSDIVFFFENGAQVWYPDVDKAKMFIRQRLYNVGLNSVPGPLPIAPFGDDLAFLSQDGIRSLSLSSNTNNRIQQDIGAPVRELPIGYQPSGSGPYFYGSGFYPRGADNLVGMDPVEALFITPLSQLWFVWPHMTYEDTGLSGNLATDYAAGKSRIVVMSFGTNRQSWTQYLIPLRARNLVTGTTAPNAAYMLQSTNSSAPYNPTLWVMRLQVVDYDASFNAVPIDVTVEWPFLDCDAPGGMKNFQAMDWIGGPVERTAGIKFLYDPNDETRETITQNVTLGDTRPRGLVAVEVSSVAIAPVLTYSTASTDTAQFKFSGLQLYYEADAGPR
jgi:hypothetical protein